MENQSKHITFWLAGICIIIFIFQLLIPNFTESFMLTNHALEKPWQFLTAIFLHGSITHLFYNLFALILFGFILEKTIGSRKFLWLFIISGVLANLISFQFYPSSLGASGAIMAILGTLAILRPTMTVWAFNLPMPMFIAAILWAGGSVIGIFGFGDQSVGHIAHLSGLAIGIIYGIILRIQYPAKKQPSSESPLISEDYIQIWENNNLK
jgi:membrane associated rhomboid family serine protease